MDQFQAEAAKGDLTLSRVFEILGEQGHAMLILFLCLPFLQPIPLPGLSTPLGLLIAIVALFLFLNRPPWLPQHFANLKISSEVLVRVSEVAEKIWLRAAKILHPRMIFFHDYKFFRICNLLIVAFNAFLLALPLPIPFSNTVPVIAIVLNSIGHIEKDGLLILASYLWCLFVLSFFGSLAWGAIHFL
jgi:hypothetical protein